MARTLFYGGLACMPLLWLANFLYFRADLAKPGFPARMRFCAWPEVFFCCFVLDLFCLFGGRAGGGGGGGSLASLCVIHRRVWDGDQMCKPAKRAV